MNIFLESVNDELFKIIRKNIFDIYFLRFLTVFKIKVLVPNNVVKRLKFLRFSKIRNARKANVKLPLNFEDGYLLNHVSVGDDWKCVR